MNKDILVFTTIFSMIIFFTLQVRKNSVPSRKCEIVINASNGPGATIKYLKEADLEENTWSEFSQKTPFKTKLEKAKYKFRSYRNQQLTGESMLIDCTKSIIRISIIEVN